MGLGQQFLSMGIKFWVCRWLVCRISAVSDALRERFIQLSREEVPMEALRQYDLNVGVCVYV